MRFNILWKGKTLFYKSSPLNRSIVSLQWHNAWHNSSTASYSGYYFSLLSGTDSNMENAAMWQKTSGSLMIIMDHTLSYGNQISLNFAITNTTILVKWKCNTITIILIFFIIHELCFILQYVITVKVNTHFFPFH